MAKVKVQLEKICATNSLGRAPFIESLRAVRKQVLPAKTFYWLNKISAVIETEFGDYEAARINLVQKLGTKVLVDGCESFSVGPEKFEEFKRELDSLNGEIELPLDEGVKLTLPAAAVAEDWFILMNQLDIFAEPA